MRIDLYLKVSRLVHSRSTAQELCELGLVAVNGAVAKPAKEIKEGDSIRLDRRGRRIVVEVVAVPKVKQVSKAQAPELYRIVSDEKTAGDDLLS